MGVQIKEDGIVREGEQKGPLGKPGV